MAGLILYVCMYIGIRYELLLCDFNCKPGATTWHAFEVGVLLLLRLDLTGEYGGNGLPYINSDEVIPREVSWMRYGLTGSRYCH